MKTISKTYPKILPKVYGVQAVSGGSTLPRSGCPLEDHPLWNLAAYTPGPSLVCWDDYGRTLIQLSNPAGDRCDLYIGVLTAAEGVISGTVAYIPSGTAWSMPWCKMLNEDNVIGARVIAGGVIELVQRLDATWTTVWTSGADAVSVGDLFELIFRGTDVFVRVAGTTLHQYALPAGLQGEGYAGYQQHRFDDADAALVHDYRLSLEVPALEWFVRPASGAPYGDGSGINYDNAWGGLREIDWDILDGHGDTLNIRGTFDQEHFLNIQNISDLNIDGSSAVIECRSTLTGYDIEANWTDETNNVWSFDTSVFNYSSPKRLWFNIDLVEGQEVASQSDIVSEYNWYADTANSRLYLYSTVNPAIAFSDLRGCQTFERVMYIYQVSNMRVTGLTLSGGYSQQIRLVNTEIPTHDIVIDNCNFIYPGSSQVVIGRTVNGAPDDEIPYNIDFINNILDSKYSLSNLDYAIGFIGDGIKIDGLCRNVRIQNNRFYDNGHAAISLQATTDGQGLTNIDVSYNYIESSNITYSRGFGISAEPGNTTEIRVHHNVIKNTSIQSQIRAVDVHFVYNIIDNVESRNTDTTIASGLWLAGNDDYPCHDCIIANNTIINTDANGLDISGFPTVTGIVGNNVISNNILYNNGRITGISLEYRDAPEVTENTITNNCIFSLSNTDIIRYRDATMDVETFNNSDQFGDVIENNIQVDPQLDGYHIPITSPAYEAGIWIPDVHAGAVDIDGDPVDEPVSIGCDEGEEVGTVFYDGQKITYATEVVTYSDAVLTVIASERGTISGQGIDCGSDCETTLPLYGGIELTASANSGYYFHSWIGEGLYTGDNPLLLVLPGEDYTIRPVFGELVDTETPCMTSPTTPLGIASTNVHYDDGTYNLEGWKGMSCTAIDAYDCWCTPTPTDAADLPVWLDWREASATPMTPTRFRIRPRVGMGASWYPENNPKEISLNVIKSDDSEVEVFRIVNENWDDASAREWTVDTEESGVGIRLYIHSTQGYDDGGDFHTCVGDFHVWGETPSAIYYTLTVDSPTNGTITGIGIDCPGDCTEDFEAGTEVILTANPADGYQLETWTGDCTDNGDGTATVIMSEDQTCGATFVEIPPSNPVLTVEEPVNGTIRTEAPSTGIDCPGDCSEEYVQDEIIFLEAVPDTGFVLEAWTGACQDIGDNSARVVMDGDKTCGATFIPE